MGGVKQITFSLAKLMTIMPIAFTRDSSWSTNGIRGSSANYFQCLPVVINVTRLGDFFNFGQLFKAFGNN